MNSKQVARSRGPHKRMSGGEDADEAAAGSVLGTRRKRKRLISSSASAVRLGGSVNGRRSPALAALDLGTSEAGRRPTRFRWITPMPPSAMASPGGLGHLVIRGETNGTASRCRPRRAAVSERGARLGDAGDDDDVVERQSLEAVEEVVIGVGPVNPFSMRATAPAEDRQHC